MGMLAQAGAELTPNAEDADVIVVNWREFLPPPEWRKHPARRVRSTFSVQTR